MLFLKQKLTPWQRLAAVLIVLSLAIVAFAPVAQGVQRFNTIITRVLTVQNTSEFQGTSTFSGAANFDGATDFDSTVDFSGATVTGVSTSTLSTLTVTGATALNGGLTMDTTAFSVADTTGNAVISGTLGVTDTQTNVGLLNANGGIAVDTSAFTVADATGDTVVSGTLTVTSTSSLNDDLDMNAQPIVNIGNTGTDFGTDGGLTMAAGITISDGNAVVADFARLTAQTAISVTDGGVITPTGSYQQLESGGAVTATMSSGCTAGNLVVLVNTVDQAIVISETATSALSGNASLGQYDAIGLLCDGMQWVQTAPESDN